MRKVEKELEVSEKKYKAEIEQLKNEEKELSKNITLLEEKIAKGEKKNKKQKEKLDETDQILA